MNDFLSKLIDDFEDWGSFFSFNPKAAEKVAPKSEQKVEKSEQSFFKPNITSPFDLKVNGKDMSWISDYFSNLFSAKTGKKLSDIDIDITEWKDYDGVIQDSITEIINKVCDILYPDTKAEESKAVKEDKACGHHCKNCDCGNTYSKVEKITNENLEIPEMNTVELNDGTGFSATFSSTNIDTINDFIEKIKGESTFENCKILINGGEYPVKIEETPIPKQTMSEYQNDRYTSYMDYEPCKYSMAETFKEALDDGYFIEFRNGRTAYGSCFEGKPYGEKDCFTYYFFNEDWDYMFNSEDFDESGNCAIDVENASEWDVVKVYGNTYNPFYATEPIYAPVIWKREEIDLKETDTTYKFANGKLF